MKKVDDVERKKLKEALSVALKIPFIDDIEDYIWESIFAYTKGLVAPDPLAETRSKKLFDLVDEKSSTGWSCKALQKQGNLSGELELVVQRADIFKKASDLGFRRLSIKSDPQILGNAIIEHLNQKIRTDSRKQNVKHKRISILIKNSSRTKFIAFEENLFEPDSKDFVWKWTDSTKTGLQGIIKTKKFCKYRWYPNQKQLFERFVIPTESEVIEIAYQRVPIIKIIETLKSV